MTFLDLPQRSSKPRERGLTHVLDSGLSLSQVDGLIELAAEIFSCPVELAGECPLEGDQGYASRPELTTVLGLLHYARVAESRMQPLGPWGRVSDIFKKTFAGIGLF